MDHVDIANLESAVEGLNERNTEPFVAMMASDMVLRGALEDWFLIDADDVGLSVVVDLAKLDPERCAQPGTQVRLVLDTGCLCLPVQTTGVERAPLTIRRGANSIRDQHVIVKLRVQRSARAMAVADAEHPSASTTAAPA